MHGSLDKAGSTEIGNAEIDVLQPGLGEIRSAKIRPGGIGAAE
jgi:hypothetical protein